EQEPEARIGVLDKLTYAGHKAYLGDLLDRDRVEFYETDIADLAAVDRIFRDFEPTGVFHLAAESHVDRSIEGPRAFLHSNVDGTFELLEAARKYWDDGEGRFLHVSTDEVYGELEAGDEKFDEETAYDPSSPYSASKAAADHFARAYHRTYGLDVVLTNCSNNFGPYQYPEKLIPVMIRNIRDRNELPVYGDGQNVRDWLFVEDHCRGLLCAMRDGESGRSYNIGATNEWKNLDLVKLLCDLVDDELGRPTTSRELITFVADRPGHDQRYAVDASRIREELGWAPRYEFREALRRTVRWYLENLESIWGIAPG
ncbi:MAG: dTDP-glucose 4,6-dehydratase, partial [Bradymonadaceae bacterium]